MSINSKSDRDRIRQRAHQNRVQRERDTTRREAGIRYLGRCSREADAEWKRQLALMPRDTRDLTGRLMGDPIPGDPRRALAHLANGDEE